MFTIYCITDIHGLQYVGRTNQTLNNRLCQHRCDKKNVRYCSSRELNLDDCMINILEECYNQSDANEAEIKWIKYIPCVNKIKYDFDSKKYDNQRDKESKRKSEKIKNKKKWLDNNKDYKKIYEYNLRLYKHSWGGDSRYNNNLLCIDVNLFNM